jgi:hypothetical protein
MTIIDTMTSLIAAKDIRAFEIEGDCDTIMVTFAPGYIIEGPNSFGYDDESAERYFRFSRAIKDHGYRLRDFGYVMDTSMDWLRFVKK